MNALMGFVSDALTGRPSWAWASERDQEVQHLVAACLHKLLWLQNDLINRHHQGGAGQMLRLAG